MSFKFLTSALVVSAIVLTLTETAEAVLIAGGSTRPEDDALGNLDGSVSFAVFRRDGGGGFGAGISGFSDAALSAAYSGDLSKGEYLYVYQIVNDKFGSGTGTLSIRSITISLGGRTDADVETVGTFAGLSFFDPDGPDAGLAPDEVGASGNNALGVPDSTSGVETTGATIDWALPSGVIGTSSGAPKAPGFVATPVGTQSFIADFTFDTIPDGGKSILFGFTSDFSPFFGLATFVDGGPDATGTVLTLGKLPEDIPLPEPGTLALLLTGLPLGVYMRRRRNTALPE